MKKQQYRFLMTLPAHRDHEEAFAAAIERGYTYLRTQWLHFDSGVVPVWELAIVETIYADDQGKQVAYFKELTVDPPKMTRGGRR